MIVPRRSTSLRALLAAVVLATGLPGAVVIATATPAAAATCDQVLIAGSSWLGGQGVDVRSNGQFTGTADSCREIVRNLSANPPQWGYGWQCPELVNRLYMTRGWISGTWFGNGADMYGTAPAHLAKEPQGSITRLAPGDVVVFGTNFFSGFGHVGVVGTMSGSSGTLYSQNTSSASWSLSFSGGTISFPGIASADKVIGVVHAPGNVVGEGSFVAYAGDVYRIAGGAPIYVSNWAVFGGAQPTTALSAAQFGALPQYPAEGTFITGVPRGEVYRVAGGAPVYVGTWDAFGGPQPSIGVDVFSIDNAGGGGVLNHLRFRPADGTFVVGAPRGEVYRIAGGGPIYVSSWDNVGGQQPTVAIDVGAIDNAGAGGAWSHLRYTPAEGTFLIGAPRGEVYRVAGGAPIYVSSWDPFGGSQPATAVDVAAIDNSGGVSVWSHMRHHPADGTFVRGLETLRVYRTAGGAPLYVDDCNALGFTGCNMAYVDINQSAVDNAGGAGLHGHLRRLPADGTVLLGRPSDVSWTISAGCRTRRETPSPSAVAVNDSAVAAIALCDSPSAGAVADFDGNASTDISVFRPSAGQWLVRNQAGAFLGAAGDIPVPCDYDGNGDTDEAVFRPSVGGWYVNGQAPVFFGLSGDVPVPGDYDGDGDCDIAVFRPSVGGWYVQGRATVFFGLSGDIPVPGDYDANGSVDVAVFRPSVGGWYRNGAATVFFGLSGDVPVPGDYDANGSTDVAVYRPSVGGWYRNGAAAQFLGLSTDIPQPGDYDGNGSADLAVYRPATGAWYVGAGAPVFFGSTGDLPLPLPAAIRMATAP